MWLQRQTWRVISEMRDFRPFGGRLPSTERADKILVFAGAPRSGTTLLGQLLNVHPECLVANEWNLLVKMMKEPARIDKHLRDVAKLAYRQFQTGLENDPKFGPSLERYQPQWKPTSRVTSQPIYSKSEIRLIGDKKAGSTAVAALDDREAVMSFLEAHPQIHLLHVVRDPVNAGRSYVQSHPHEVQSVEAAMERIGMLTSAAHILGQTTTTPYHHLYYEDLVSHPEREIQSVLDWLGIACSGDWLDSVSNFVNRPTSVTNGGSDASTYRGVAETLASDPVLRGLWARYLTRS